MTLRKDKHDAFPLLSWLKKSGAKRTTPMDYSRLVTLYSALEQQPGRLKKTELVAALLADAPEALLPDVALLAQGLVFPPWDPREVGIAEQSVRRILSRVSGAPEDTISAQYSKLGDYGTVLERLARAQRTLASKKLTVEKVVENLRAAASVSGAGTQQRKAALVAELLAHAAPAEAKYVIRTVLGQLRAGVAEGVLRDAIAKAFFSDVAWGPRLEEALAARNARAWVEPQLLEQLEGKKAGAGIAAFRAHNTLAEKPLAKLAAAELWKPVGPDWLLCADAERAAALRAEIIDAIEWAWFLRPDYGAVAAIAKRSGLAGLKRVRLETGRPIAVLLAEKAPSLEEALAAFERPALEWKYDGMRCIMQKRGERVWLFTRRLEDITAQFPDIVSLVRSAVRSEEAIIEGEVLALTAGGKPRPFQDLSQRIKRKHGIHAIATAIPVQVNAFDALLLDGEELFDRSLEERRALLEKAVREVPGKFQLSSQLVTKDLAKAKRFYESALAANQEGVMVKNLDARYQPGRRAGYWLKVKPVMESLDLAIIGAEWGTGKRTGWFGTFVLGCRTDEGFKPCGMIGTGVKEKSAKREDGSADITFEELTKLLRPHIIAEHQSSVDIEPAVIVEVAYEEVQRSPTYASGYALRFPRVLRLRFDKGAHDADSVERLEALFRSQKGKR